MDVRQLEWVFQCLLERYGSQGWWPADSAFEVMLGAILTQNTSWQNVERAIAGLREAGLMSPEAIAASAHEPLAAAIRPAGYFNVKASRLKAFTGWYLEQGGLQALSPWPTEALRQGLLSVKGVGRETADDICLYAFHRPVFVIDAYTRRLFARLGLASGEEGYEALRIAVERALGPDTRVFNEFHALIVRHGKEICRPQPACQLCCLAARCPASLTASGVRSG